MSSGRDASLDPVAELALRDLQRGDPGSVECGTGLDGLAPEVRSYATAFAHALARRLAASPSAEAPPTVEPDRSAAADPAPDTGEAGLRGGTDPGDPAPGRPGPIAFGDDDQTAEISQTEAPMGDPSPAKAGDDDDGPTTPPTVPPSDTAGEPGDSEASGPPDGAAIPAPEPQGGTKDAAKAGAEDPPGAPAAPDTPQDGAAKGDREVLDLGPGLTIRDPALGDVADPGPAELRAAPPDPGPRVLELKGALEAAPREGVRFDGALRLPKDFQPDQIDGLGESGLSFDRRATMLRGDDPRPGTYRLTLHGDTRGEYTRVAIEVTVTPDPWSMWKDLPSNPDGDFAKPDLACAAVEGQLLMLAASRRGRKHAHVGDYRDDDAGVLLAGPWHIGAVADGAGSADLSREGSRLAVATVLEMLPGLLDEHVGEDALFAEDGAPLRRAFYNSLVRAGFEAARAVEDAETAAGAGDGAMSTTLIAAAGRALENGDWLWASFSVGDGLCGLYDPQSGEAEIMMAADSGEFAGQTHFLRVAQFRDAGAMMARIHIARRPPGSAMFLMTDGISDPLFPTPVAERDPGTWATFWNGHVAPALSGSRERPEAGLADWLNFKVRGEHDDRSLVAMLPPLLARGASGNPGRQE